MVSSPGAVAVPAAHAELKEYRVPDVFETLQLKHPRLFGGEVSGALMHTLQSVLAERSEQREHDLRDERLQKQRLQEELADVKTENAVLKEREVNSRDRTRLTDVTIASGGILFAFGLTSALESPTSFISWGIGLVGIGLLSFGFILSSETTVMSVPSIVPIDISGPYDRGVPNHERIVFWPNSYLNLAAYGVVLLRETDDGSRSPCHDNVFWFGSYFVAPPIRIFLYTGPGSFKITTVSGTTIPAWVFHWGKPMTIFADSRITPALISVESVSHGQTTIDQPQFN